MEKIPSLIIDGLINPAHDWIFSPSAKPTQMWDGIPYAVIEGKPYSHFSSSEVTDSVIACGVYGGKFWGWQPVPENDELFWKVWQEVYEGYHFDWSYELIGPEVLGNPEESQRHVLWPHGTLILSVSPEIENIASYLATHNLEGIVWWEDLNNQACRKAKVQQSDFGFRRRRKTKWERD